MISKQRTSVGRPPRKTSLSSTLSTGHASWRSNLDAFVAMSVRLNFVAMDDSTTIERKGENQPADPFRQWTTTAPLGKKVHREWKHRSTEAANIEEPSRMDCSLQCEIAVGRSRSCQFTSTGDDPSDDVATVLSSRSNIAQNPEATTGRRERLWQQIQYPPSISIGLCKTTSPPRLCRRKQNLYIIPCKGCCVPAEVGMGSNRQRRGLDGNMRLYCGTHVGKDIFF
jgi:hypothetical protein